MPKLSKLAVEKTWRRMWPRKLSIVLGSGTSGCFSFLRCGEFWEITESGNLTTIFSG